MSAARQLNYLPRRVERQVSTGSGVSSTLSASVSVRAERQAAAGQGKAQGKAAASKGSAAPAPARTFDSSSSGLSSGDEEAAAREVGARRMQQQAPIVAAVASKGRLEKAKDMLAGDSSSSSGSEPEAEEQQSVFASRRPQQVQRPQQAKAQAQAQPKQGHIIMSSPSSSEGSMAAGEEESEERQVLVISSSSSEASASPCTPPHAGIPPQPLSSTDGSSAGGSSTGPTRKRLYAESTPDSSALAGSPEPEAEVEVEDEDCEGEGVDEPQHAHVPPSEPPSSSLASTPASPEQGQRRLRLVAARPAYSPVHSTPSTTQTRSMQVQTEQVGLRSSPGEDEVVQPPVTRVLQSHMDGLMTPALSIAATTLAVPTHTVSMQTDPERRDAYVQSTMAVSQATSPMPPSSPVGGSVAGADDGVGTAAGAGPAFLTAGTATSIQQLTQQGALPSRGLYLHQSESGTWHAMPMSLPSGMADGSTLQGKPEAGFSEPEVSESPDASPPALQQRPVALPPRPQPQPVQQQTATQAAGRAQGPTTSPASSVPRGISIRSFRSDTSTDGSGGGAAPGAQSAVMVTVHSRRTKVRSDIAGESLMAQQAASPSGPRVRSPTGPDGAFDTRSPPYDSSILGPAAEELVQRRSPDLVRPPVAGAPVHAAGTAVQAAAYRPPVQQAVPPARTQQYQQWYDSPYSTQDFEESEEGQGVEADGEEHGEMDQAYTAPPPPPPQRAPGVRSDAGAQAVRQTGHMTAEIAAAAEPAAAMSKQQPVSFGGFQDPAVRQHVRQGLLGGREPRQAAVQEQPMCKEAAGRRTSSPAKAEDDVGSPWVSPVPSQSPSPEHLRPAAGVRTATHVATRASPGPAQERPGSTSASPSVSPAKVRHAGKESSSRHSRADPASPTDESSALSYSLSTDTSPSWTASPGPRAQPQQVARTQARAAGARAAAKVEQAGGAHASPARGRPASKPASRHGARGGIYSMPAGMHSSSSFSDDGTEEEHRSYESSPSASSSTYSYERRHRGGSVRTSMAVLPSERGHRRASSEDAEQDGVYGSAGARVAPLSPSTSMESEAVAPVPQPQVVVPLSALHLPSAPYPGAAWAAHSQGTSEAALEGSAHVRRRTTLQTAGSRRTTRHSRGMRSTAEDGADGQHGQRNKKLRQEAVREEATQTHSRRSTKEPVALPPMGDANGLEGYSRRASRSRTMDSMQLAATQLNPAILEVGVTDDPRDVHTCLLCSFLLHFWKDWMCARALAWSTLMLAASDSHAP